MRQQAPHALCFLLGLIFQSLWFPVRKVIRVFFRNSSKSPHFPRWWIPGDKGIIHYHLETLTGSSHQVSMTTQLEGLMENKQWQQKMSLLPDWLNPNYKMFRFSLKIYEGWGYAWASSWVRLSWSMPGQSFSSSQLFIIQSVLFKMSFIFFCCSVMAKANNYLLYPHSLSFTTL